MKKLLLILLCLPLLFSCGENEEKKEKKDNTEKQEDPLKEKINYELSKDKEVNDIFLNFKFGDSEKEVNKKFTELVKEDKIDIHFSGKYIYEFKDEIAPGTAVFSFDYYQDKLYQLTLMVDPKNISSTNFDFNKPNTDVHLTFFQIRELYVEKFGEPILTDNTLFSEKHIANSNLHWINGNRLIEIKMSLNVTIKYIDLNIQSLAENEDQKQEIILRENMKKDL